MLTIDHMLLECEVLQESRDEYYTVDSMHTLFETIPENYNSRELYSGCLLYTSPSPRD